MTNVKDLEQQVADLKRLLAMHGIREAEQFVPPETAPDYIAHGSAEHVAFLGLVEVGEKDDASDFTTFTSPETKRVYRLLDEVEAVRHFPGIDPEKAARLLLRQKVNSLESGKPQAPPDAPPMWKPTMVF